MADNDQKKSIASNEKSSRLITKEVALEVLRKDKGSDAIFKSYEVKDFTTVGDNYSCFVTGMEVDYMIEGKTFTAKYVAKINPKRANSMADTVIRSQFNQEHRFYAEYVPEMNEILKAANQEPIRVPKFYHYADEAGSEILFCEDMRTSGFVLFDKLKGIDQIHAELVFREVGRLHAAGKLMIERYGEQEAISKFNLLDDVMSSEENQVMVRAVLSPAFLLGSKLSENFGQKYQRAAEVLLEKATDVDKTLQKLVAPKQPFATIQHGDCWNNNILYRYEDGKPVEVCLLDLQMTKYASVGIDLNYLLFSSFNGPVRKDGLEKFLDIYYSAYKSCLPTGKTCHFTRQELRTEYENKKEYGLTMGLMVLPMIASTGDQAPNFDDVSDEELPAKMAEYELEKIKIMTNNAVFRQRFIDMLDEMIAAGILV